MPEMRAWFRTKYEGRRHRTALEYAPRKTIVAMHFRAGGIVGSHMFRGRWIEPAVDQESRRSRCKRGRRLVGSWIWAVPTNWFTNTLISWLTCRTPCAD